MGGHSPRCWRTTVSDALLVPAPVAAHVVGIQPGRGQRLIPAPKQARLQRGEGGLAELVAPLRDGRPVQVFAAGRGGLF